MGDLLNTQVMAYMDDIMLHTPSIEEHVKIIIKIFDLLRKSGLKLNLNKTKLFCKQIKYLGHVIDANGIKPNEQNIESIKNVS